MSAEPEPLFILSCHRSGSTLLRFALDTHPEIYGPPELFLGTAAFSLVTFFAGLEGKVFERDEGETAEFSEILALTRQILAGQISGRAASRGKRLWCEKTPDNLEHLNLLRMLFPQAKYLCLYRHCLDVAKSALEISEKIPALLPFLYASRGHLVTALIRYWTEWNGRLLRFEAAHPGRCHRVLYEDLVGDPTKVFGELFSFLDLDWNEELIGEIFVSQHDPGVEDFKVRSRKRIHQDSVGAGNDLALAGVPDKVLHSMRELLKALGYPPAPGLRMAGPGPGPRPAGIPNIARLFDSYLPARLQAVPMLAEWAGVSCHFAISGDEGGDWVVEFGDSGARVLAGGAPATCIIHLRATDLVELVCGRLSPLAALRDGRLRIEGPMRMDALLRLLGLFLEAKEVVE